MFQRLDPSDDNQESDHQRWKASARAMVDGIPVEGATIIVITNEIGRYLKDGIRERRDRKLARACRIISVNRVCDCDKLIGLRGRVIIDSSIHRWAKATVVERTDAMLNHPLVEVTRA